jgi:hypothetical protein
MEMGQKVSMFELARMALAEIEAGEPLSPEMEIPVDTEEFGQWLLANCAFRDRWQTAVSSLHIDFARWRCERAQPVPVSRRVFEDALRTEGFLILDGFVTGLLLPEDLAAHEVFQADESLVIHLAFEKDPEAQNSTLRPNGSAKTLTHRI